MISADDLQWSSDYIQLDVYQMASEASALLEDSTAEWVVFHSDEDGRLAALRVEEALERLGLLSTESLMAKTVFQALELGAGSWATIAPDTAGLTAGTSYRRPQFRSTIPVIIRHLGTFRLGGVAVRKNGDERGMADESPPDSGAVVDAEPPEVHRPGEPEDSDSQSSAADGDWPSTEDEGRNPVRYPEIQFDGQLEPGKKIVVTVDALFKRSTNTEGDALDLKSQDESWQEIKLETHVSCPLIDFDTDQNNLVIRRNKTSLTATFSGVVSSHAGVGESLTVQAAFFHNRRFCGTAKRKVTIGGSIESVEEKQSETPVLSVDVAAESPDLTVFIWRDVDYAPNRLHWRISTKKISGLPPRLDGSITLGFDPGSTAKNLFAQYARLKAGEHVQRIHALGDTLWELAPEFFRDAYWAMYNHYQRALSIQFVTDDPHMPWELMRPVSDDGNSIHPPLAIKHRVARWLSNWIGWMPNKIGGGELCTIAPNYKSASMKLPRAMAESKSLVDKFKAISVPGTRQKVIELFEDLAKEKQIAMIHFAGHGVFNTMAAVDSELKLEDGTLTAGEVGRPETRLGKRCRSLVFLNACEVGATGEMFGNVGGWADVLLKRHFGGFIAPLWAVEDQDASLVAQELVKHVLVEGKQIGEVLRSIRERHGKTSPTFYSYLYYGDVNARISTVP